MPDFQAAFSEFDPLEISQPDRALLAICESLFELLNSMESQFQVQQQQIDLLKEALQAHNKLFRLMESRYE